MDIKPIARLSVVKRQAKGVGVEYLARGRGGELVREAEPEIRLLEDVQEARHRPAARYLNPEIIQVGRLGLGRQRRQRDPGLSFLSQPQVRILRHVLVEHRKRRLHLSP